MRPKDRSVSAIKMVSFFLVCYVVREENLLLRSLCCLSFIMLLSALKKKKNHNPVCTHSGIFLWFRSVLTDL